VHRGTDTIGLVRGFAVVLAAGCAIALGFACTSFDGEGGDGNADAAAADVATLPDSDAGAGADAVATCTPAMEDDAGPDADCNGTGLAVDLTSSPDHCGRCARSCRGGSCAGGYCTPQAMPFALDGHLTASAADGLYVASNTSAYRVGFELDASADLLTVAPDYISALVPDGDRVYVNSQSAIGWVPRANTDGGLITSMVGQNNDRQGLAVDSANVYYTYYSAVRSFPKDGGAEDTVKAYADPSTQFSALASADDELWWLTLVSPDAGATNELAFRNAAHTTITTRAPGLAGPAGLRLTATHAYWVDVVTRSVMRVSRASAEAPEVVATYATSRQTLRGFAVDDTNAYWAVSDDAVGGSESTIYEAPLCGGFVRTLEPNADVTEGLAVHGDYLYWSGIGGLVRVAK
jgi:hypothetical protein